MAAITCILDKNVHRTVKFNLSLTDESNKSIILKTTPTATDPYACTLEISMNGRTLELPAPGCTLLSKRTCEIDVQKNGQYAMNFPEETFYRVMLLGNELVNDPNISVTMSNKKIVGTNNSADYFVITEKNQPTVEISAGSGLKIPPGVE